LHDSAGKTNRAGSCEMESRYVGQDVSEMSLEDLGDRLRLDSKTQEHREAQAEINVRQMKLQMEATAAQKLAANAEQQAAEATVEAAKIARVNARLLLVSVFVAAVSAVASAVSAYYAFWTAVHPGK